MPSAATSPANRQRAYRGALRDLARFAQMQRQMVEIEAAAMSEGF